MRWLTSFTVSEKDFPEFEGQLLHPVCSTYRLGQELEWAGRLLYLEKRPEGTDAIGTSLFIEHDAPAFAHEVVEIWGEVLEWDTRGNMTCKLEGRVAERLICKGQTGQRVMPEERIRAIFRK